MIVLSIDQMIRYSLFELLNVSDLNGVRKKIYFYSLVACPVVNTFLLNIDCKQYKRVSNDSSKMYVEIEQSVYKGFE